MTYSLHIAARKKTMFNVNNDMSKGKFGYRFFQVKIHVFYVNYIQNTVIKTTYVLQGFTFFQCGSGSGFKITKH